jgi:NAD(P)-dependent dehydrogenase (short-subunit alcohol dehydrogenase family)
MEIGGTAALVTGGAGGLGAATAKALAQLGSRVFALDLAESLGRAPALPGVTYLAADVTDPSQVEDAIAQAAGSGVPLRIAVNCAGISPVHSVLSRRGRHDLAMFRQVVEINLVGTFNVLVLAAEAMSRTEPIAHSGRGVIVNTASIAAFDGTSGTSAYAASKGGVVSLGLPAARDLAGHGIRVMTIAPGSFDTRMIAGANDFLASQATYPKRLGHPEEFAALVRDIIGHDYLNGEVIRLDAAVRLSF